jgi:hypothetical protein
MRMNSKKTIQTLTVVLAITIVGAIGLFVKRKPDGVGKSRVPASVPSPTHTSISIQPPSRTEPPVQKPRPPDQKQLKQLITKLNKKYGDKFYRKYFNEKVLKSESATRLNKVCKKYLPSDSAAHELMRIYIVEGLARNGSPEFSAFMYQLMAEMRAHSTAIESEILTRDADLKRDPLVYQMTLNMISILDLPPANKAQLLGKAFEQKFEFDSKGKMTPLAATITNAFILMKKSGVSASEAKLAVEQGFRFNDSDETSKKEFLARVISYYPELSYR